MLRALLCAAQGLTPDHQTRMSAAITAAEGLLPELSPWQAAAGRPDPIGLLEQHERYHLPWLIPERHRRMAESPWACFRGTAAVMAWDLAMAPHSDLQVQLVGDAQLLNFAFFRGSEGLLDFDLHGCTAGKRGPYEWDLKRLVCSLVLAADSLQLPTACQERLARHGARSYRRTMGRLARRSHLQVWFSRRDHERWIRRLADQPLRRQLLALTDALGKPDSQRTWRGLCQAGTDGRLRFRHDPPRLWRQGEEPGPVEPASTDDQSLEQAFAAYLASLPAYGRSFLSGYQLTDSAVQPLGLGSAGSHRTLVLLQGALEGDVLLLECERVLTPAGEGQPLIPAALDPLLGCSGGPGEPVLWRQFRSGKGVVRISQLDADGLDRYGRLCARTLARAHARCGDRVAMAARMAVGKAFDRAIASWALAYAKQAGRDQQHLLEAIATGRLSSCPA